MVEIDKTMSTVENIEYEGPHQSSCSGISRIYFHAGNAEYESWWT
jgi:hypothetical protein